MSKKSISSTTILSFAALIVVIIILLSLSIGFSKRMKKTEEISIVNKCKLPGTNNYCCEPYSANEITPREGGWQDCQEPKSACCVG